MGVLGAGVLAGGLHLAGWGWKEDAFPAVGWRGKEMPQPLPPAWEAGSSTGASLSLPLYGPCQGTWTFTGPAWGFVCGPGRVGASAPGPGSKAGGWPGS